jgi:hypothetical protein
MSGLSSAELSFERSTPSLARHSDSWGALALTRYMFEVLVWFPIPAQDQDQGIEFHWQVIEK